MGKSKKTRWRTFEISGSQDETQTNGADVKVNGTNATDTNEPATSQKYSQILGDHHSNSSTQFSRNSSHHIYKSRNGYNKENFYNQRSGGRQNGNGQRSWQRGSNYRTAIVNGKDRKPDEDENVGSGDAKVESSTEPKKFNEDEYTRITTPRQDVLFKKGYLSRMNNKTVSNLSATVNSTESTAASSTITTSDPDSSVSTLSPATTPSMDYGQMDSMEYAPMYYPGYYDENGMLVIPMYNGYNYYPPPSNGSAATSPVYLMPYPYQYDPFFMTPGGIHPADGDEITDEKTENDGAKENNQNAENQNGALTTSSEDGASSDHCDEKENKKEATDNGTENPDEITSTEPANPELKQNFPIYPNELNGYMYPAYHNGYYNGGYYYYNGMPTTRPPKMRRRKRFLNTRNSHQTPRSAETTTDYSDDETTTQNKRFGPRFQNGWTHHNGYNHFNGKIHRFYVDQNANQSPHEFQLNVDVQEFYPRVQLPETQVNCDVNADLERKDNATTTSTPKPKAEAPKVTKTSPPTRPTTNRVSKKEIIEGIKSMEQQNIDLAATKPGAMANASQIDEWAVIKKGKKVKVVKDVKAEMEVQEIKPEVVEEVKVEEISLKPIEIVETVKKPAPVVQQKSKKSKNKNKKKKPQHMMVKQNGFEIIEPEFNSMKVEEEGVEETPEMSDEEPEITELEVVNVGSELFEELVLNAKAVTEIETPEVEKDLKESARKVLEYDDDVIDISDEDICSKTAIPVEALVKEAQEKINAPEMKDVGGFVKPEVESVEGFVSKKILKKNEISVKPEVVKKADKPNLIETTVKPEIAEISVKQEVTEIAVTPVAFKTVETSHKLESLKSEVQKVEPEACKPQTVPKTTVPETLKTTPEVPSEKSFDKPQTDIKNSKKPELKLEIPIKTQPEVPASKPTPEVAEKKTVDHKLQNGFVKTEKKQESVQQKATQVNGEQTPEANGEKKPEVAGRQKLEVTAKHQPKAAENPSAASEVQNKKLSEVPKKPEVVEKHQESRKKHSKSPKLSTSPELPLPENNDKTNIAALERDLMENLRLLDDDFDLKSPIINPLFDFPITSAVRKWLQEKQNESFDSLFHVQNLKKLSELYDDDDDDETESDISEKELKSETDSDYASDFQAKANGGSPTCSTHAKGSSKCNKLIAKESFCALM